MLEMDQMDFVCVKYRIDDTTSRQSLLFVLFLRIFAPNEKGHSSLRLRLEFCSRGEVN